MDSSAEQLVLLPSLAYLSVQPGTNLVSLDAPLGGNSDEERARRRRNRIQQEKEARKQKLAESRQQLFFDMDRPTRPLNGYEEYFAKQFKEMIVLTGPVSQNGAPYRVAHSWATQLYAPTWLREQLLDRSSAPGEFEIPMDEKANLWRTILQCASKQLSYVAPNANAWDSCKTTRFMALDSTFEVFFNRTDVKEGTKTRILSDDVVRMIYLDLVNQRRFTTGSAPALTDKAKASLIESIANEVQMANRDPRRPLFYYELDKVEISLEEYDVKAGAFAARFSADRLAYMHADRSDFFRGYSIYPQKYSEFTPQELYHLPENELQGVEPEELHTYTSSYLSPLGETLVKNDHAASVNVYPRLSKAALQTTARTCNRDIDFLKTSEWNDLLVQVARERSPDMTEQPASIADELSSNPVYGETPSKFLTRGMMYRNDVPFWEVSNLAPFCMDVRICWRLKTPESSTPPPAPRVLVSTDFVHNNTDTDTPQWAVIEHRTRSLDATKLYTMYLATRVKETLFTIKFDISKVALTDNGRATTLRVRARDYNPDAEILRSCVQINIYDSVVELDNIFYSPTIAKEMCNLALEDGKKSGYGEAIINVAFDAAESLGVSVLLTDNSYSSSGFGTPFAFNDSAYEPGDLGSLTATLTVLRGYGYYEGFGFMPLVLDGIKDATTLMDRVQERIDYQHVVTTTRIFDLRDELEDYHRRLDPSKHPGKDYIKNELQAGINHANALARFVRSLPPPITTRMSLREIALKINSGEIPVENDPTTAATRFMDEGLDVVTNLLSRTVHDPTYSKDDDGEEDDDEDEEGDSNYGMTEYPNAELRARFIDYYGEGRRKAHFVITRPPDNDDPMAKPVVSYREVKGMEDYRLSQKTVEPSMYY